MDDTRRRKTASGEWANAAAVLWLLATTALAACSDSAEAPQKTLVATPVDPATAGTVDVTVRYDGPVPAPQEVNMRSAPQCAAVHGGPMYDPSLLVKGGALANAVVWIKGGLQSWTFAPPNTPVVIDQTGCLYEPHVAAAMVNQTVEFVNSDPEPHNVHGRPSAQSGWNFIISRKGASRSMTFEKAEVAIPVGCDIHPWMRAYLAIIDNPYYGVTGADGSVVLKQVPPGQYVVGVWHEKLGTKDLPLKLEAKGTAKLAFTYGDQ